MRTVMEIRVVTERENPQLLQGMKKRAGEQSFSPTALLHTICTTSKGRKRDSLLFKLGKSPLCSCQTNDHQSGMQLYRNMVFTASSMFFKNFLVHQSEILSVGPVKHIFPVTAAVLVCIRLSSCKLMLVNISRGLTQQEINPVKPI